MDLSTALDTARMAAELAASLTNAVAAAMEAGKDGISDEELKAFIIGDDKAKENLANAIQEAISQGR